MADFGQPIAQNVNVSPNQGIQTLSGILGLRQQQLALQTGQALKASAEADATSKGIEAQGQKEASNFLQNFDLFKHFDSSGTLDPNSIFQDPGYEKLSGPAKETVANAALGIRSNQLKTKADLATLNGAVVSGASRLMGALATDPDVLEGNEKGFEKTRAQWALVKSMYPDQGAAFASKFEPHQTPENMRKPGDLAAALRSVQMMGEDISQQQSVQLPAIGTQVGPGGQTQGIAQSRITGEVTPTGGGAPLGLSPAQLAAPVTMPNGQIMPLGQFLASQGRMGGGMPAGPPGAGPHPAAARTAASDAPPPNAPKAVQDAYQAAVANTNQHVQSIRTADENYGLNMRVADQIRSLSKTTTTGPGAASLHNVMGYLGLPFGANNVADYQLMGAYLDRQAATMRQAMGLPSTNEGIQTSQAITGNTEYQAKALQDKNDLTQALSEGFHQYRNGLDRIAGFSGQASPSAVAQFKNAWTDAFDPNVYRGELAYKRGKKEGDAFVASLDPAEAASLKRKRAVLNALSQGKMPQ